MTEDELDTAALLREVLEERFGPVAAREPIVPRKREPRCACGGGEYHHLCGTGW